MSRGVGFTGRLWNELQPEQKLKLLRSTLTELTVQKHKDKTWEELSKRTREHIESTLMEEIKRSL